MKKPIKKLEDVLALDLQSLYAGEMTIKKNIEGIISATDCVKLKEILKNYAESSEQKRLKLNRMFSYLMVEPSEANTILTKLLNETQSKANTVSDNIKSLVLISSFQQINQYKICSYKTALMYALELELDTVADLLHQIIEWEDETKKALSDLCVKEFNKCSKAQSGLYNIKA